MIGYQIPHTSSLDAEQVGYKQTLGRRHVQMIAIGGAIGTGLFLGSASRLLAYRSCPGAQLRVRRPDRLFLDARPGRAGAAPAHVRCLRFRLMREFFGERWAFVTGWVYLVIKLRIKRRITRFDWPPCQHI